MTNRALTPGGTRSAGEIESLADELAELARHAPGRLKDRLSGLTTHEEAELALRLPPQERVEMLLHAPKPMQLVRSLPDVELYLTVREVGPTDAMPLLSLASATQITHVVDLESWRKDRFDGKRSGAWVALLLESGEPTLRRFLRTADDELLALLFQSWLRVEQIETDEPVSPHGVGETEAGTEHGFVSPDGAHRFSPVIPEHGPAVRRLAELFFQDQHERYFQVIWSALHELPSELEENALRWRQSRLEEHGFPSWEDALSIYAPPEGSMSHPEVPEASYPGGLSAPRSALRALPGENPVLPAVNELAGEDRERVLHELAALANHVLVADSADTGDPAALRGCLRKAAGFASIALEARNAARPAPAARVLADVPLVELFREGYARATSLQTRARRLDEPVVRLLDPPLRQNVDGLLARRPLYHDPSVEPGRDSFRDFRSLAEIDETARALRVAEILGEILLGKLGDGTTHGKGVRFSTVFLTAMAWHATRDELRPDPLPADVTADFLRTIASGRTAPPDAKTAALERFVESLRRNLDLAPQETSVLRAFGLACLERLTEEFGTIDPGTPLTRGAVSCLILS